MIVVSVRRILIIRVCIVIGSMANKHKAKNIMKINGMSIKKVHMRINVISTMRLSLWEVIVCISTGKNGGFE
jgi:hypothetical protein